MYVHEYPGYYLSLLETKKAEETNKFNKGMANIKRYRRQNRDGWSMVAR